VLCQLGCLEMQGFLFSSARPAGQIRELFVTHYEGARGVRQRRPKTA